MRNKLLLLGVCALLSLTVAAVAWADKFTEGNEKYWNPNPQEAYTDVPEVEPNNDIATATPISCGDVLRPAAISPAGDNDYISFNIAATGTIISFGTDQDGTSIDTYIYLYNPSGTQVATDDDSGPGLFSLITYTAPTPGTYTGRIRHYSSTGTGSYKAFVNCSLPEPPPVNDTCAGAIDIPCGPIQLSGSTQWAINDYDPRGAGTTSCTTNYAELGRDVVYKFTIPAGTVFNATYVSTADASFYVITDCADPVNSCVVGTDAAAGTETINYTFTTGGLFYLILDSYGANTWGTWTLNGSLDCPTGTEQQTWGAVKNIYR